MLRVVNGSGIKPRLLDSPLIKGYRALVVWGLEFRIGSNFESLEP